MVIAEDRAARMTVARYVVAAVMLVGASVALSQLVGRPAGAEQRIVIPAGTATRLAAGERLELMPADLQLQLEDRLVVVNDDRVAHQIGPFLVQPGERLEKRFSEAMSFQGFCSLHPGGGLTLEISR